VREHGMCKDKKSSNIFFLCFALLCFALLCFALSTGMKIRFF
jgi:hypothetical protein